MASSGSFSGSIRSGHYALQVDWSQTQDVSNNQSVITCKLYLVNDWSLAISSRSTNTCVINGVTQNFTSPAISTTGTHLLGTVSQTVPHNSDGTKSVTISASFKIQATLSGTYYDSIDASASVTLNSIARASSVSMDAATMGSAASIKISRASSSFTHTLTYAFGTATGTIATKTTATTVSWTPPLTLAEQIPKALTGTGTITCTTYNGNTNIGSKTCTLNLTVPATVKPSIGSLTAARVDGDVPGAWGIYVQSKSKATLAINGAAGSYGSTISSYSITGGGFTSTASSFTTGLLNVSGNVTFTATVTDSRGRVSDAKTVIITVQAYSPPAFLSYESQRCLSTGAVSDEGTYVRGVLKFQYSDCGGKNTVSGSIRYKRATTTAWTSAGVKFTNGAAIVFGSGGISAEYSYEIEYTLTDGFSSVSILDIVSTAAVVMDFKKGGKGVAVGKVAEKEKTFEVTEDWDVRVYGKLLKEYIQQFTATVYPVGSIYMSVNPTNPSSYFGGTWVAWGAGRVPVGINTGDGNFNTVEKTGGASTVTLTEAQMPSHTHAKGTLATASGGAHTHNLQNQKAPWGLDGGGNRVIVDATSGYSAVTNKATTSAGAHTHTISGATAAAGSGNSHSNLQPYIVCYMWKRTA